MGGAADDTLPAPGASQPGQAAFAPGAHVAGRYRIDRFIASGAMGDVYAAEDLIVGGMVALKTVRPELEGSATALERLRREIAIARKVTNAHICRLHDVGEHEGRAFITMEFLDGVTLAERITQEGALGVDEVGRIGRQLVAGLAALHAHGIVHRDFKTANVMIVGGRAVITDFGLARSIAPDALASLTVEASLLGTPAYMAPEQVEGRDATPASDIYALGAVLFEMLTGAVPFHEDTALATATARLQKDPPRPSSTRAGISAEWDARVLCCLERDPAKRFVRVDEVLDGHIQMPSRRGFVAAIGAGVVGVAGLGALAWKVVGTGGPPSAEPLASGDLVAVLPVADAAFSVDLQDALATAGLPILALETARALDKGRAFAIPNVKAVVELKHEPTAVTIQVHRRGAAGSNKRLTHIEADQMLLVEDAARAIASGLGAFTVRHAADAGPFAAYHDYSAALAALFEGKPALLEKLVEVHPKLARAHAWLADHYAYVDRPRARAAADAALALDRDQALALAARGREALFHWNWTQADADSVRAAQLAPTNARVMKMRATYAMYAARFDEAVAIQTAASRAIRCRDRRRA